MICQPSVLTWAEYGYSTPANAHPASRPLQAPSPTPQLKTKASTKQNKAIHLARVLDYYDLHKPVVFQTDPREDAVGAAFLQPNYDGKLQSVAVTFSTMKSYGIAPLAMEKECLVICSCFQRYNKWIYSKTVIEVHTDHQPLKP